MSAESNPHPNPVSGLWRRSMIVVTGKHVCLSKPAHIPLKGYMLCTFFGKQTPCPARVACLALTLNRLSIAPAGRPLLHR